MPTANDATPTHEVLTHFVLNPTQLIRDVDLPRGPQACAMPIQM